MIYTPFWNATSAGTGGGRSAAVQGPDRVTELAGELEATGGEAWPPDLLNIIRQSA